MSENEYSHDEPSSIHCHLGYLDEFLRLRCAPDLIEMGLFPNAKEITESFAVWAALRRHILPQLSMSTYPSDNLQNAIIVVGDGMTPRTAALCAFLTKRSWQCYSIDPMLQYDTYVDMTFINKQSFTTVEHCNQWKSVQGLRMIRSKIQTISIQCRQAIVVMMHAHVTVEDAIAAVDATEGIVGLVTCPCCKWAPFQQEWLGQAPHQPYIDLKLLSVKNQMNVWCFPQGKLSIHSTNTTTMTSEDRQLQTGRSAWGIDTRMIENVLSNRDGVKQRAMELWSQIFSQGIQAFNINPSSSDDFDTWLWGSTTWSPRDVSSFLKSCDDIPMASSWFHKPILLVGTIAAVRRCKHTIFYEMNSCTIPSKELEDILRPLCPAATSTINSTEEKTYASSDTFPALLKSADRIWTCVEYQRHFQAVTAYDPTVERNTKKQNSQATNDNDRVNVVLSCLSYERQTKSTCSQSTEQTKVNLFSDNPQARPSLFPWAMSLRLGDILVAYCALGRNASKGPQLCLIDGILLFDSMLHMIGVDRRVLR